MFFREMNTDYSENDVNLISILRGENEKYF
jgi:hypothetical protein